MITALLDLPVQAEAALIAAVVSLLTIVVGALLGYAFDQRSQSKRRYADYEFEQRRELRALIGRSRGRMIEAAARYAGRMEYLYEHADDSWLAVDGVWHHSEGYYFRSTVLRFLVLQSLANRFEQSAFYIDSQLGEGNEETFLWMAKAIKQAATEASLMRTIEDYDPAHAVDHFYSDQLRDLCRVIMEDGSEVPIGLQRIEAIAVNDPAALEPAFRFFDGISRDEARYRWDRLVVIHLLAMAFWNEFGYARKAYTATHFDDVVAQLKSDSIREALPGWLKEEVGIDEDAAPLLCAALLRASRAAG